MHNAPTYVTMNSWAFIVQVRSVPRIMTAFHLNAMLRKPFALVTPLKKPSIAYQRMTCTKSKMLWIGTAPTKSMLISGPSMLI